MACKKKKVQQEHTLNRDIELIHTENKKWVPSWYWAMRHWGFVWRRRPGVRNTYLQRLNRRNWIRTTGIRVDTGR